ncbi:MAG: DUF502 domain-containing protein [Halolamina sp.]
MKPLLTTLGRLASIRGTSLPALPLVDRAVGEALRQVVLSGVSVTGPLVVTAVVVGVVLDFLAGMLEPFVQVVVLLGLAGGQEGVVVQALVVGLLAGAVFVAGVLAESSSTAPAVQAFGNRVSSLPGVGSVYSSFDQMSEVMLDGDANGFREVKLVEFPNRDIYSLAFQTADVAAGSGPDTATADVRSDGEDLVVLFVPLAPNPVMGGFMVCVPESRVRDVEMTVQEAFQAIITSGVAMSARRS